MLNIDKNSKNQQEGKAILIFICGASERFGDLAF